MVAGTMETGYRPKVLSCSNAPLAVRPLLFDS